MVWFAIIGCSSFDAPFAVQGARPDRAVSGTTIQVQGEGFIAPVEAFLEREGSQHRVDPRVDDRQSLHFDVPALPAGPYTMVVQQAGQRGQLPFVVLPAPPETPCKRPYQANTELSLSEGVAVIVRFHPDGRTERERIRIDTIEALEVQSFPQDGSLCSAIHLLRTDGTRVLFEDGPTSLAERAKTLGGFLGKPVQ